MKKKTIKIRRKIKRIKETNIIFSRNAFAPRTTVPHQMKMKTMTVILKEYSSWKYNIMNVRIFRHLGVS
jgi:Cu/Ag efflux pump CusA